MSSPNPLRSSLPRLLVCALFLLISPLWGQSTEHHKLVPTDGAAGDEYGSAVATDGLLVAIGAPRADQSGPDSGSAYVAEAFSGAERFELVPNDGAAGDRFGSSIGILQGRVAVGAPHAGGLGVDAGAVYIFDATSGAQLAKLEASDGGAGGLFGQSLAMDGNLLLVGAFNAAYLFDLSTGQELRKLAPIGGSTTFGLSGYGEAVAIDGPLIAVGARLENGVSGIAGACYVYDTASGSQLHRLVASNGTAWSNFGAAVALRGSLLVIGTPESSPTGWHSGSAYFFDASSGQQLLEVIPSDGHLQAEFGVSVSIDGFRIAIGAEQNNTSGFSGGAVYLYDATSFNFHTKLVASDGASHDQFGCSVEARNGVLIAGAFRDDDLGPDSGSAYVFDGDGSVTPMTSCQSNAGNLFHLDGLPAAGQSLVFRMDVAQAQATSAVFAVAAAPAAGWPTCGVNLGSAGELLIDTPVLMQTVPWNGFAHDFSLPIPHVQGLAGFPFFVQGAFLAPTWPTEPIRLTNGFAVVLGGYL